ERRVRSRLGLGGIWPHVVRVRQTKVLIETVSRRQELRLVTEVPLAENRRGIAFGLEHLRNGDLAVADTDRAGGSQRTVNADPIGVRAGQQGRARSRADGL